MKENRLNVKTVALSGVLLALCVITLFLAGVVPGLELSLYALSSFYAAAVVVETKSGKGGLVFYVASVILSFLIVPNKAALLPYLFFFGLYGLVKYYVERLRKTWAEIVIKLLFFNLSWGVGLYFFKALFLANIGLPKVSVLLLAAAAEAVFLVYDFVFTLIIGFYHQRIHGKISRT